MTFSASANLTPNKEKNMSANPAKSYTSPTVVTLFALTTLLLAGCISSDAQHDAVGQKKSYALEAAIPRTTIPTPCFGPLKILSFKSQPPFEANNLIVRRANGETVMDYYTTWIAAPHELIRVQTMSYLRKTGLFKAVYDSTSGSRAQTGLEGTVEQILLDCHAENPTALITLRFTIIDETTPDFTVLWSTETTGRSKVEAGPLAIIDAFDKALSKALEQMTHELEKSSFQQKK
jgi:ABC-type uncharacterized transport system auxiliary subunit